MTRGGRGRGGAGLALLAALLLGGCLGVEVEPGVSARDGEIARQRAAATGPFRVAETGPHRAVLMAEGRRVVLVPVDGLCLAEEAFDASADGAFAVIAECVAAAAGPVDGAAEDAGQTVLPPSFAGLVTVSVAGEPMFADEDGRSAALRRLRDLLGTAPGLALLGRNGAGDSVEMLEARQIGDALYVHVRDVHDGGLALLAPEFWRGFVEINRRLVLVTVSGFRQRPLEGDDMLAVLAAQIARLREENGGPVFDAELELAAGFGAALRPGARMAAARTDPSGGLDTLREAVAAGAPAPRRAPAPTGRTALVGSGTGGPAVAGSGGTGSRHAPLSAPRAPARPARG